MAEGECIDCGAQTKVFVSSGKRAKRCADCRAKKLQPRPRPVRQRILGLCEWCKLPFSSFYPEQRYCSKSCAALCKVANGVAVGIHLPLPKEEKAARLADARRLRMIRKEVLALRRIAGYVERPAKRRRKCQSCEEMIIVSRTLGGCRRVCLDCTKKNKRKSRLLYFKSDAGRRNRRIAKARRRAIERGVAADKIDPIAVFDRDKWKCKLCGTHTPRRLRGTYEPNAPELDHVVPISLGGAHIWSNVQCSCRKCNGDKGATIKGQLALALCA